MTSRNRLLAALLLWWLPWVTAMSNPCQLPEFAAIYDGLGGTGRRVGSSLPEGFGGTGHVERGGLGGTARPDQLFVRGVVTGFGSICVNGLEIHYASDTPLQIDGRPAAANGLAVGQVVDIRAVTAPHGFGAEKIAVEHALAGPVEAVDPFAARIRVAGVPVEVPASALAELNPGQPVAVSGLQRPDGGIHATRIDPAPPGLVVERPRPLRLPEAGLAVVQAVVAHADRGSLQLVEGPTVKAPQDVFVAAGEPVTLLVRDGEAAAIVAQDFDDLHDRVGGARPVWDDRGSRGRRGRDGREFGTGSRRHSERRSDRGLPRDRGERRSGRGAGGGREDDDRSSRRVTGAKEHPEDERRGKEEGHAKTGPEGAGDRSTEGSKGRADGVDDDRDDHRGRWHGPELPEDDRSGRSPQSPEDPDEHEDRVEHEGRDAPDTPDEPALADEPDAPDEPDNSGPGSH